MKQILLAILTSLFVYNGSCQETTNQLSMQAELHAGAGDATVLYGGGLNVHKNYGEQCKFGIYTAVNGFYENESKANCISVGLINTIELDKTRNNHPVMTVYQAIGLHKPIAGNYTSFSGVNMRLANSELGLGGSFEFGLSILLGKSEYIKLYYALHRCGATFPDSRLSYSVSNYGIKLGIHI